METNLTPPPSSNILPKATALARSLALAHRLNQALEWGEAANFKALAHRLGVSTARISMLLALLNLAPDIQEDILFLDASLKADRIRFDAVLKVARECFWVRQRELWRGLRGGSPRL